MKDNYVGKCHICNKELFRSNLDPKNPDTKKNPLWYYYKANENTPAILVCCHHPGVEEWYQNLLKNT
jgi:hypothetical protein